MTGIYWHLLFCDTLHIGYVYAVEWIRIWMLVVCAEAWHVFRAIYCLPEVTVTCISTGPSLKLSQPPLCLNGTALSRLCGVVSQAAELLFLFSFVCCHACVCLFWSFGYYHLFFSLSILKYNLTSSIFNWNVISGVNSYKGTQERCRQLG